MNPARATGAAQSSAFMAVLLVVACAGSGARPQDPGGIPRIPGPMVGGGLSTAEAWRGARTADAGAARIQLGRLGEALAIRTETARASIATVLVAASDRVWLLHASAALGTAEYRCQADGRCRRVRDFEWSCRDPAQTPEAVACRAAFRAKEGWIGNVSPAGGTVRELVLSPERFGSGALRLVVTVLSPPDQPQTWPAVTDDVASLAIQQGALPDEARFDPGAWLVLPR